MSNKAPDKLLLLSYLLLDLVLKTKKLESNETFDYLAYAKDSLTQRLPEMIDEDLGGSSDAARKESGLQVFEHIKHTLEALRKDKGKVDTSNHRDLFLESVYHAITSQVEQVKIQSHELIEVKNKDNPIAHEIVVSIKMAGAEWHIKTLDSKVAGESEYKKLPASKKDGSSTNSLHEKYYRIAFEGLASFVASEKIVHEYIRTLKKNNALVIQAKKTAMIMGGDYNYYLIPLNQINLQILRQPDFISKHAKEYINKLMGWSYSDSAEIVEKVLKTSKIL